MSLLQRLSNLIKGTLSMFISGLEKERPEALLELEKENLRKLIAQYNEGLAAHAGLAERLMGQVKKQEAEEQELIAKTTAHLKAGNQEVAAKYALRLQQVKQDLEENRRQLEEEETTYKNLVRTRDLSINEARAKIEKIARGISDLKVKRATADLSEMAAGMISSIGGAGDTLNRLEEMVESERTQAAGRARVARDSLPLDDLDIQEVEQQAMANQALASFAAEAGIALEPDGAKGGAEKDAAKEAQSSRTMGPGNMESQ